MDPNHQKIKEHPEYLEESTDVRVLLPELRKTTLTKAMLDDIDSAPPRHGMLSKSDPDAFDPFVGVPQTSNYVDVALKLEDEPKVFHRSISNCFTMQSDPRGYCLIINNVNFKWEKQRRGSERDAKELYSLFEDIGYDVKIVEDRTRNQILETLNKFSKRNFSDVDSCVVCILSHGMRANDLDAFLGVESELVYIHEVLQFFNTQNCPELMNKPKMFFIQACRGRKHDFGEFDDYVEVLTPPNYDYGEEVDASTYVRVLEVVYTETEDYTDTFVMYSTLPNYVSVRNRFTGSWFCSELVKVFRKYAHSMDLESMGKLINNNICKRISQDGLKQAVATQSYDWYRKLYFNPIATDLMIVKCMKSPQPTRRSFEETFKSCTII